MRSVEGTREVEEKKGKEDDNKRRGGRGKEGKEEVREKEAEEEG